MTEPIELRKARLAKFISEVQTVIYEHKVSYDLKLKLDEVIVAAADELSHLEDTNV